MISTAEQLDGFINAVPFALILSDGEGTIAVANGGAERLFGYNVGELVGQSIEVLVPRHQRDAHVTHRADFAEGGTPRVLGAARELRGLRKDGTEIAVLVGIARWETDVGMRVVTCVVDNEPRRLAEAAANEQHRKALDAGELSQAIIRDAALGIIMYDAVSGQCVLANHAAANITGVAPDALGRQRFREIESWKVSGLLEAAETALATGKTVSRDIEMISTPGKRLSLNCECLAITFRDRPHLVLMMDDLTERRNLEAQLRVAQKMEAIGQLAGGVAHDFNNLLTVIGTYSSLMLEEFPPGDPHREDLEEIYSAAQRAATLTRQLLAFGRRQLLDSRLLDLNEIVEGLEKMLRRVLSAEIVMHIVPGAGLGAIHADAGQIEQAIMNLVVNARDAMPSGGVLTIETRNVDAAPDVVAADTDKNAVTDLAPKPMVMLRVTDTGQGMDAETLSKVFEPFFTTKDPGRGTGLGLSTTYGIVKQSGGIVRVRSQPDVGSVFELSFPRMGAAGPAAPTARPMVADATGVGDILVVEDDEHVRKIVVTTLRGCGYAVIEASDGEQALDVARQRAAPPDLLVTDVIMPKLSGLELVARLRQRWPALRVLFTTAYALDEETGKAASDFPGPVLKKPFIPAELADAVQTALRGG